MFEFADHAAALDTANAVICELMNTENVDDTPDYETEMVRRWHGDGDGDKVDTQEAQAAQVAEAEGLSHRLDQPISRRRLLRAALLQEESV